MAATTLRERALSKRFPTSLVITNRRTDVLISALRYVEHEPLPAFFSLVADDRALTAWRGTLRPRVIFTIPTNQVVGVTTKSMRDGAPSRATCVVTIDLDGARYELPFFLFTPSLGSVFSVHTSPRHIQALQSALT